MTESGHGEGPLAHRLIGEDAPPWLPLSLALSGLVLAVTAAWVFLLEPPMTRQAPFPGLSAGEQGGSTHSLSSPRPFNIPAQTVPEKDQGLEWPPSERLPVSATAQASQGIERTSDRSASAATPSDAVPAACPEALVLGFKQGSSKPISTGIEGRVKPFQEWLRSHPSASLLVEGHASPVGSEQSNLILSYQRAKAVVAVLKAAGVPHERLVVRAAGEDPPASRLPGDHASNRRVQVQVRDPENCRSAPDRIEAP